MKISWLALKCEHNNFAERPAQMFKAPRPSLSVGPHGILYIFQERLSIIYMQFLLSTVLYAPYVCELGLDMARKMTRGEVWLKRNLSLSP